VGEFTPTALLALLSLFPLTAYAVWAKRPAVAVLYVVFAATLFGPEGAYFKFPGLPGLDKHSLPYALLFGVALFKWRGSLRRGRLGRGPDVLVMVAVLAGFVTWRTNLDPLRYGALTPTSIPSLSINDAIQYAGWTIVANALPFIIGRSLFRTRRDITALMRFLVIAGLIQIPFILVEIRLSPQLHSWIYGYAAHPDFLQTMRWGGYRPMVFMVHGLALSLFMCAASFAAIVLAKVDEKIGRWKAKWIAVGLLVVIIACKSTGSILYAAVLGPLLAFASHKTQVRIVVVVALIVALYPLLRANDIFPADYLVQQAQAAFGEDRASSLAFRFDNEDMLLTKARERSWFGWGGFGRGGVYSDEDGSLLTVTDGHWIIVLSTYGTVGMVTRFGLLLIPILALRGRMRELVTAHDRTLVVGLAVICAVLSLDLVPNGLFATYPYLLAGALWGVLQEMQRPGSSWSTPREPTPEPRRRRTRRRDREVPSPDAHRVVDAPGVSPEASNDDGPAPRLLISSPPHA
jgi:hypothetical protein